jgi:integrase
MAEAITEPGWDEMVHAFLAHLADEERSDHTLRNYRSDLGLFARWYADQYDETPELGKLAKRHLLDWTGALELSGGQGGGRAAVPTVNRKLSAVRSFFRWAATQDRGVRFEPPKPRRRQGKADPRWLSKAEERALIAAAEVANSARDLAILWLGLHGGLRCAEMEALEWSDVTISERKGELIVRKGKGRKERVIKLSKTLRHALLDLGGGKRRGRVLTGRRGDLSYRGIQDIALRYGRAARVGKATGIKDFSHHCLRHTCARRMIEAGVPISDVAAHLGHSDVKTTMRYIGSKDEDLAKAAEALDD